MMVKSSSSMKVESINPLNAGTRIKKVVDEIFQNPVVWCGGWLSLSYPKGDFDLFEAPDGQRMETDRVEAYLVESSEGMVIEFEATVKVLKRFRVEDLEKAGVVENHI